MTERYAMYFSPGADSELEKFGQSVLCRSGIRKRQANASSAFPDQARWLKITEQPAHYGFHATLKAPFELKQSHTVDNLTTAVTAFAMSKSPIELTTLYPRYLGGFMALTLEYELDSLSSFAFNCVKSFESFRKTLSNEDIQRRKLQGLSSRQESLLMEYGYPYVADEFRFHMTLSSKLKEHDHDYKTWAISEYNRLISKTPVLDKIAIFSQADRQTPFALIAEFPLAG